MHRFSIALFCALALPAAQCVHAQSLPTPEVRVVPSVDLNRYMGQWVEVAAIPQFFQRKCVRDTSASYTIVDTGTVQVLNRCTTESGEAILAEGRAVVREFTTNAKLSVTFLRFLGLWQYWASGDYWVIGLDPNYEWAVVGHPTRQYGWVLSRTPSLSAEKWNAVDAVLIANGYDHCTLLISLQTGSTEKKRPLCERGQ
jgi:apolipoprotein D and lipocalin family protein